jgi:RimJ/RimL family protein N-acetyltransferase
MMTKKGFRVYLRALEIDDYKVSVRWRNDSEIYESIPQPRRFVSERTEQEWVERAIRENEQGVSLRLAVCLKENDRFVGIIQLLNIDLKNRCGEVTTMIGEKEYWGQGLIGEARILMFEHSFLELGLERISNKVLDTNTKSLKAYDKFGSVREGVLRNAVYKDGAFHDLILFSMLREEFLQRYPTANIETE